MSLRANAPERGEEVSDTVHLNREQAMATKSTKQSSGAAATKAAGTSQRTAFPRTAGTAGPDVAAGTGLTGRAPPILPERHGGLGTATREEANKSLPAELQTTKTQAETLQETGPVVEGTGGGLEFERQPSGSSRARPTKEQPTPPERAEIVEGRRLQAEISKSVRPAGAPAADLVKVGDRVRILRSAASGWETATIVHLSENGGSGAAETEAGETVALEPGRWEPMGLLAPALVRDQPPPPVEGKPEDQAKSMQAAAKPSRARATATRSTGTKGKGGK